MFLSNGLLLNLNQSNFKLKDKIWVIKKRCRMGQKIDKIALSLEKEGTVKFQKAFTLSKKFCQLILPQKAKISWVFYCKSKSHLNKSLLQTCCVFIHWYNWVKIVTHHLIGQFYKMNCHLSFLLSFLYFFCSPLFF